MKKTLVVLVAIMVMSAVSLYGCIQPTGGSPEKVSLQITKTTIIDTYPGYMTPEIETREVKKGDKIELEWHDLKATVTIKSIKRDSIEVGFSTRGVVREIDGRIELNSGLHRWSDEIEFGEEYTIATQTQDGGMAWTFVFDKAS